MGCKSSIGYRVRIQARVRSKGASAVLSLLLLVAALAPVAMAQSGSGEGSHEIFAGSELENYLRYMQIAGRAAPSSWSIRPLSPSEIAHLIASDSAGPWSSRFDFSPKARRLVEWKWIAPAVSARFNTGFPYGVNDGPIWAGRGLTTSAQGGFFALVGPLSLTVDPIVFRAENNSFELYQPGTKCPTNCENGLYAGRIDLPQRFGNKPYQRFDPGESTLRLDALGASAGFTTASEWWGPTQLYPYLLGTNAAGFPHAFFGSARPVNILIGKLHARVIYGRLDQTEYSPVSGSKYYTSLTEPGRVRFASGVMTVLEPRGMTGLEVGVGRFVHSSWPSTGLPREYFTRLLRFPLSGAYETGDSKAALQSNQLASGFFRWIFPKSHLEFFGEYGAEDSHYDLRGSLQEPDYTRAYSLGLRRSWNVTTSGFDAFHFELMNYEASQIQRYRTDDVNYVHNLIRQGHTNRGQLLGSPLGPGASAGSSLSWNRYTTHGRTTIAWDRVVSQESGSFFETGIVNPHSVDVSHALSVERVSFAGLFD